MTLTLWVLQSVLPEFATNTSCRAGSYARLYGETPTIVPPTIFAPSDAATISVPPGAAGTVNAQGHPVVPGKLPVESDEHREIVDSP
ncbi:MAG: hypothetical protein L3J96_07425, partial [Thermoplasmata archaeon]|nr:hypothetical protein [Thermoplasmata archaeon]